GRPETGWHGLRDVHAVVRVAAEGGVGLWLHGHRHGPYFRPPAADCPFPTICAGSASQRGIASHAHYVIDGRKVTARRRVFDVETGEFRDGESFDVTMST